MNELHSHKIRCTTISSVGYASKLLNELNSKVVPPQSRAYYGMQPFIHPIISASSQLLNLSTFSRTIILLMPFHHISVICGSSKDTVIVVCCSDRKAMKSIHLYHAFHVGDWYRTVLIG